MLETISSIVPSLIPLVIVGHIVGCVVIGHGIFRLKNIFYVLIGCAIVGVIF